MLAAEYRRQEDQVELIASENYVSPRVLQAQGSVLTNKYASGYPGRRHYSGCEHVDEVETLAIERLKQLYGAAWANVQTNSGSQANLAAFFATLKPGDCFLGMKVEHGGHLTHGYSGSFSGRCFNAVQYGVDENGFIDYDEAEALAIEHRPKLVVAGFSIYSRVVDWRRFRHIADRVGALLLVDMAHVAGLVAAGLYPNPLPVADLVTSTTHKTLRGPRSGIILGRENPDLEQQVNSWVYPGLQSGPLMHVIAGKAMAFAEALQPEFSDYQKQMLANARALAERLMEQGLAVVTGGTDNHMLLLSLLNSGLSGRQACDVLNRAHITSNASLLPRDPDPAGTSGLRLGSAAVTTRGFREDEMRRIADCILDVLQNRDSDEVIRRVRGQALELCRAFPVYAL